MNQNAIALIVAALMSLGLVGVVTVSTREPVPAHLRDPSPGFGWSWNFNFEQAMAPGDRVEPQTAKPPEPPAKAPDAGPVNVAIGKAVSFGKVVVIYRGKADGGLFLVDTIIPALDPDYPYSHRIDIAEARKGFSLAGQRFVLRDIGRNNLKLERLGP